MDRAVRRRLQGVLLQVHPWLADAEHGPTTLEAGECDRCGNEARLVTTCGPAPWRHLGRRCAGEVGLEAWCDGHLDEAEDALAWLQGLPAEADDAARLWWVATGEVRLESLAELLPRALPGSSPDELSDFH